MYKFSLVLIAFISVYLSSFGQYDPLSKPNTYRSKDNPNYWQNKLPRAGYWQQDVHYAIKANIDEKTNIITGAEQLTYWNNSPDELTYVFFHLYQNAFQPGSYYDNLQENNKKETKYGPYETQLEGTLIDQLRVDGKKVKTELDNTILKVWLNKPLVPGGKVIFDIDFRTMFDNAGNVRRRMKIYNSSGLTHYNGVHWYPRISVYDSKFGWTTDQHLGREFYGDFGTFDVELTFADNYVVGATGFLTNRSEMLPETLRDKLAISNFATKPWNSPASVITPYNPTRRKTWIYHAENVHDFAFTADPSYRIGEAEWNGVKVYALVMEPHAAGWQNAAEYTAEIIRVFSEDIGMYTYNKMIVADAEDGMEYPMLTLDGGYDPGYRYLFAHEVGHNWFFGQVGNNETYRASLDEGFTQFLTAWALQSLEGDTIPRQPTYSKYYNKHKDPELTRFRLTYQPYLQDAVRNNDGVLNTHSDGFDGALHHGGGYRHVYYKTATMLYNLQYVLGDELFLATIQNYFSEWKIAHPYFDDFRKSVVRYTKMDLNWFFDQWLETDKTIDYGIKSVRRSTGDNNFEVTFKRKGRMQMPIDFTVQGKSGKHYNYYIPNTWFEKETEATILPRWIGWDKLQPTYTGTIHIPEEIVKVSIDTTYRLADVNMLDNSTKLNISHKLDHQVYNAPDFRYYEMKSRPELWYNGYDGFKTGWHSSGGYMNTTHMFDLTMWFNSGLGAQIKTPLLFDAFSYRFIYKTRLSAMGHNGRLVLRSKHLDGLDRHSVGITKSLESGTSRFYAYFKSMWRADSTDLNYLIYKDQWDPGKMNNALHVGMQHDFKYMKGKGWFDIELISSSLGSQYDYSNINFTTHSNSKFDKMILKTRTYIQFGWGDNWAKESMLYLAGDNPEGLMQDKYTRSTGFVPQSWGGYGAWPNHFQDGGGLNLRGYAGYLAPIARGSDGSNDVVYTYAGQSGASVSAELEFNKYFKIKPRALKDVVKITTYLFADAGVIDYELASGKRGLASPRMDAGLGALFTINPWRVLEQAKPLNIRFDMPFFLNRIPATETAYFKYRWIVGINRSF